MILHTVNKPPTHPCWQDMQLAFGGNDGLLLIEDACYALQLNAAIAPFPWLIALSKRQSLFILQKDAEARSIGKTEIGQMISDSAFVDLICRFETSSSWY